MNINFHPCCDEELIALLSQNLESRLSEAFKSRNLETVKNLAQYMYVFNTSLVREHLHYFVKNACENDDWFNYFQDLICEGRAKINLDVDIGSIALDYAACHCRGEKVVELLIRKNVGNKVCNSDDTSIANKVNNI